MVLRKKVLIKRCLVIYSLLFAIILSWYISTPKALGEKQLNATLGAGNCCTGSTSPTCSGCEYKYSDCVFGGTKNHCGNYLDGDGKTVRNCTHTDCDYTEVAKVCISD